MQEPQFPQRVLRAPKAFKPKSSSDIPEYLRTTHTVTPSKGRGVRLVNRPRSWMTDLEGKTFAQALPVMRCNHTSYKIIKVDDLTMADRTHTHDSEVFLTLKTNQAFTGSDLPDRMRASEWLMQNSTQAIVMICEK
jgi:hypothetical protein